MKTLVALALTLLVCFARANAQSTDEAAKTTTVYVVGAVAKTGKYDLPTGAGAMNALTAAGGLVGFGQPKRAYIIHRVTGDKPSKEPVNLKAVIDGVEKDKLLREGDTLVIPEANVGQKF